MSDPELRSVKDFFEEMQVAFRSATPWSWPRSLADDELDFWRQAWPKCIVTSGVMHADRVVIQATCAETLNVFTIDLSSMTFVPISDDGSPS